MNSLIAIRDLCASHNIEPSFFDLLYEFGLISIIQPDFVSADELETIEKCIHLHYEMEINIEGIDAIHNLLEKINDLQAEIRILKNRLRIYEGDME